MRLDVGDERTREWLEDLRPTTRSSTRATRRRRGGRLGRGRGRAREPLLPLPGSRRSSPTRPSRTTTSPAATRARSSTSPAWASSRAPSDADAARALRRVPARRRAQRYFAEEAEEAEYPLVAGIAPKPALPPLADSPAGPTSTLGVRRRARADARAAERDRLHVVSRVRGARTAAAARRSSCPRRHRRAAAAPARVPRRPRDGGAAAAWRVLDAPDTLELDAGAPACSCVGVTRRRSRSACSLAWLATRTDLPGRARLGGARRPAARDPELRGGALRCSGVRPARAAPAASSVRRRAAAGDLRLLGGAPRADALDVPVRPTAGRRRRCAGSTRRSRRRRARSGARPARSSARDAAGAPAVDRRRRAARRAVHDLRLRRRVADAVRRA